MDPINLVETIFKPLASKANNVAALLPPAWAFGHHMTVPSVINGNKGLLGVIDEIRKDLKFPLEGIVQDPENLD